jgi:hypothetical protein
MQSLTSHRRKFNTSDNIQQFFRYEPQDVQEKTGLDANAYTTINYETPIAKPKMFSSPASPKQFNRFSRASLHTHAQHSDNSRASRVP